MYRLFALLATFAASLGLAAPAAADGWVTVSCEGAYEHNTPFMAPKRFFTIYVKNVDCEPPISEENGSDGAAIVVLNVLRPDIANWPTTVLGKLAPGNSVSVFQNFGRMTVESATGIGTTFDVLVVPNN